MTWPGWENWGVPGSGLSLGLRSGFRFGVNFGWWAHGPKTMWLLVSDMFLRASTFHFDGFSVNYLRACTFHQMFVEVVVARVYLPFDNCLVDLLRVSDFVFEHCLGHKLRASNLQLIMFKELCKLIHNKQNQKQTILAT